MRSRPLANLFGWNRI